MLTSKILSHRPTGPASGRPADRLRPVPMVEMAAYEFVKELAARPGEGQVCLLQ